MGGLNTEVHCMQDLVRSLQEFRYQNSVTSKDHSHHTCNQLVTVIRLQKNKHTEHLNPNITDHLQHIGKYICIFVNHPKHIALPKWYLQLMHWYQLFLLHSCVHEQDEKDWFRIDYGNKVAAIWHNQTLVLGFQVQSWTGHNQQKITFIPLNIELQNLLEYANCATCSTSIKNHRDISGV